jgi:hypothetical protein
MKTSNGKAGKMGKDTRAALRALRRAARKVHADNRRLGLPVIVWKRGKAAAVTA